MNVVPFVTVVCPIYNEEKYIAHCVDSILAQDYPKERMEVFLVDGMSRDHTRDILQHYLVQYPFLKLLDNEHQTVPYALNKGILQASGDVIVRLDGHCMYPVDYISALVHYLYSLNADNVGGVWRTLPAKDTAVCKAIALACSHPFGVGGSMHKIGARDIMETDTVPFGCYRKEVFDRIGLFDEDLTRNQDDEFNGRLRKAGGKIYLIPDVVIDYTARPTLKKMSRMYYQYGLFKPLVNKKLGAPATTRQFVPVIFVTGILFCVILGIWWHWLYLILGIVIAGHVLISLLVGVKHKCSWKETLMLPIVFFLVHWSYGWGYLNGELKILLRRDWNVSVNR